MKNSDVIAFLRRLSVKQQEAMLFLVEQLGRESLLLQSCDGAYQCTAGHAVEQAYQRDLAGRLLRSYLEVPPQATAAVLRHLRDDVSFSEAQDELNTLLAEVHLGNTDQ